MNESYVVLLFAFRIRKGWNHDFFNQSLLGKASAFSNKKYQKALIKPGHSQVNMDWKWIFIIFNLQHSKGNAFQYCKEII